MSSSPVVDVGQNPVQPPFVSAQNPRTVHNWVLCIRVVMHISPLRPQAVFGQGGCYKCYQTGATDPGAPRSASPCLPLRPSEVVAWVASETSRERSVGVLDSVFQLRSSRCSLRRRARSVPLAAEVPHAALESDADCACLLALSSRMNRTDGPVVVFEQPPTQATKPEVAPVRLARSSLSATGRPG
jgi:hypothetical protein